jgi:hypothetical protein
MFAQAKKNVDSIVSNMAYIDISHSRVGAA